MPYRILVSEAEPAARSALEEILRDEGYEVTSAGNGAEALALLETTGADLVLLDLLMPVVEGETLLHHVRARFPELPTVLMTGLSSDEPRVAQVLEDGSIKAIFKPVNLDSLFEAIQTALAP